MAVRTNEAGQPIGPALPDYAGALPPPRTPLMGRSCGLQPLDAEKHGLHLWQANLLDEGRNWTYLPYGPFAVREEYQEWLVARAASVDTVFYAIVAGEEAVGVAAYLDVRSSVGSIEVGHLHFSPRLQRTRVATEAMFLMMRHAFEDLSYRRYVWKCDCLNEPSWRAAQRFGFSFEGVWRNATIYKGRSRDTAWFAITDGDWPPLKAAFEAWLAPENFGEDGLQRRSLSALTRPLLKATFAGAGPGAEAS